MSPTVAAVPEPTRASPSSRAVTLAILVAALGYFVDIYDLILFSIIRVHSLEDIGVHGGAVLDRGVLLLDCQMGGMLVGGVLWGMVGDKRGRLSVLFGSIVLYSVANIANGFVQTVEQYAALRFVCGVGLAGELGAGVTLVSEIMRKESRGYGTTIIAAVGLLGAIVAALVGDLTLWRTAFFIGGGLGLALLLLRVGVRESSMFQEIKAQSVARGNFLLLVSGSRLRRYACVVLTGVPIWYMTGILITFSPELARAMGMGFVPDVGRAVMFDYAGMTLGGLASGLLSQRLQSRTKVLRLFLVLTGAAVASYFTLAGRSAAVFYGVCAALGLASGYWAVFVTVASEQFGTNVRATAATTTPNFVRGAVVPLTAAFQLGKAHLGVAGSAAAVGGVTLIVAFAALRGLDETFGRDLNFVDR